MRHTAGLLVIGNQKGGVGKTSLAIHLAVACAERGFSVLLVDLCSTAGATSHLGFGRDAERNSTFELLLGGIEPLRAVLEVPAHPRLSLIPGSRRMENLERALMSGERGPYDRTYECIERPMKVLRECFDLIVLDTGPSRSLATRAAYFVGDFFLAAVRAERGASEGLADALQDVEYARQPMVNPELQFLGAVLNAVDGRNQLGRGYGEGLRHWLSKRGYPGALFDKQIPVAVAFAKAWQEGKTLFEYQPDHPALESVRAVALEFLMRVGQMRKFETDVLQQLTAGQRG